MVAPLIPVLAEIFDVTPRFMGFIEPAYLIPYGAMVLVWGPLSDRVGRRQVILGSMSGFLAMPPPPTPAVGPAHLLPAPAHTPPVPRRPGQPHCALVAPCVPLVHTN